MLHFDIILHEVDCAVSVAPFEVCSVDLEANLHASKDCVATREMEANKPDQHRVNSLIASKSWWKNTEIISEPGEARIGEEEHARRP